MPAIVSNITVPLLGLCDTAISGHLGSDLYLAAIAVGSVMLNVVFWLFTRVRDKEHHKKLNRQLEKVADSFGNITDI